MKKLRFVSISIVLLLFCPFIRQCDGMNKRVEGTKVNSLNELKTYFREESENVFEIAYGNGKTIIDDFKTDKKSIINDKGFFTIFSFSFFSFLLIFSSLLTLIFSFLENFSTIKLFTISGIVFILTIVIIFYFSGLLERFGQIKIGFYLLLLSNFYMLYLLKQKKEQIQY
jgi:hypothetical protein